MLSLFPHKWHLSELNLAIYTFKMHKRICHIFHRQGLWSKRLLVELGKPQWVALQYQCGRRGFKWSGLSWYFQKHWVTEEVIYKLLLQTLQIKRRQRGWRERRDAEEREQSHCSGASSCLNLLLKSEREKASVSLFMWQSSVTWDAKTSTSAEQREPPRLALLCPDRRAKQKDRRLMLLGFVGCKSWGLHSKHFKNTLNTVMLQLMMPPANTPPPHPQTNQRLSECLQLCQGLQCCRRGTCCKGIT